MGLLIAASIMLFILSMVSLKLAGFRFFGINPHPLSLAFLLQIFIYTLPGAIAIGIFNFPMLFDMHLEISQETKYYAVVSTFLSVSIFFLGLALLFERKILELLNYRSQDEKIRTFKWLTCISFVILMVKLASVSQIPLLLAIGGDVIAAAEAKVRILTNQEGVTVFALNYVFRSFTSYVYIASVMLFSYDRKSKAKRIIFFVNIPLALINSMYDVQKYTVVLLLVSTFWIFYMRDGNIKYLIRGALLSFCLSAAMFVVTLGYDFDMTLIIDTLLRVLTGQTEGMFYIYQFLTPDEKYLGLGMPLAGLFGIQQIDPAAEVVQLLFPTAGDTWLNANSYYLAHAWTVFGIWSIILGPIFVILNIVAIQKIACPLVERNPAIYYPVLFWLIIRLPIVNNFSDFLWFKVVLDVVINFAFVMLIDFLSQAGFGGSHKEQL